MRRISSESMGPCRLPQGVDEPRPSAACSPRAGPEPDPVGRKRPQRCLGLGRRMSTSLNHAGALSLLEAVSAGVKPILTGRGRTRTRYRFARAIHPRPLCVESRSYEQFQVLFNSLFKVLCIFPSQYLFAIGLSAIFRLRWNLPPDLCCTPKQHDSSETFRRVSLCSKIRGSHPLCHPVPRDLGAR